MNDLSDDEINYRASLDPSILAPASTPKAIAMAREIRRHRMALAATAEQVRQAVREAFSTREDLAGHPGIDAIADAVVARLGSLP